MYKYSIQRESGYGWKTWYVYELHPIASNPDHNFGFITTELSRHWTKREAEVTLKFHIEKLKEKQDIAKADSETVIYYDQNGNEVN